MINFKTFFLTLLLMISLFSCKKDSKKNVQSQDSLALIVDDISEGQTSLNNNTSEPKTKIRTIIDTQVYFFLPSPKERQDLIKFYGMYNQYQFRDIFSNFIDLSNTAKSLLITRDINVEITYAKRFIFPLDGDTIIYDVELEDQILGYILADGINPPLIKNGVTKKDQLSKDLRNYFNLVGFRILNDEPETDSNSVDSVNVTD